MGVSPGTTIPRNEAKALFSEVTGLIDYVVELGVCGGALYFGDSLFNGPGFPLPDEEGVYDFFTWLDEIKFEDSVFAQVAAGWMYRYCLPDGPTKEEIDNHIFYTDVDGELIAHDAVGAVVASNGIFISLRSRKCWEEPILKVVVEDENGDTKSAEAPNISSMGMLRHALPLKGCVLILCEDTKSSVYYLKAFCSEKLGLPPDRCEIIGLGYQTHRVVQEAVEHAARHPGKYEKIFCVFDHDDDAHFRDALHQAQAQTLKNGDGLPIIVAIPSNPCYEYWLLLHFKDAASTAPVAALPDASIGTQMRRRLEEIFPDYGKSDKDIYNALIKAGGCIDNAMNYARVGNNIAGNDFNNRPTTAFPIMIDYLEQFSLRLA